MPLQFITENQGQIRRRIGRLMFGREKFHYGTLLAATASSFTLETAKRFPSQFLVGQTVHTVSGLGVGQLRQITDHEQSTGICDVSPDWTIIPDNTTVVEIWPEYVQPEDVNNGIQLAVGRAADLVQVLTTVASPSIDSDRIAVTIPASLVKLVDIKYQQTGVWYEYTPTPLDWLDPTADYSAGSFVIRSGVAYLNRAIPSDVAGASILARGYRLPTLPTADSDTVEVPFDYATFMGAFMTDVSQAYGRAVDPEEHAGRAANWVKEAAMREMRMQTTYLPNTVEVD